MLSCGMRCAFAWLAFALVLALIYSRACERREAMLRDAEAKGGRA